MSGNVSIEPISDEEEYGEEILDENYDYSAHDAYQKIRIYINLCYFTLLIVIGVPTNVLAILILIRRRLWRNNEAYIYLTTILIINTVKLVIFYGNVFLYLLDQRHFLMLLSAADIVCKFLQWVYLAMIYNKWTHVLMLFNVYLRQQLMASNVRRECYMSLAEKYCTLFGAKVAVSSFFTVFALANFWSFSISDLQYGYDTWHCSPLDHYLKQYVLLFDAFWWVVNNIPLIVVIALLLLIFWKRKRSSRFVFTQMEGASQDNGDVEEVTRICVGSAVALICICVPHLLLHELRWYLPYGLSMKIFQHVMTMLAIAEPLSTPITCFAVKSRFIEELREIVRCCNVATKWQRASPPEPGSNGSSVLQMVSIEEDYSITERPEI